MVGSRHQLAGQQRLSGGFALAELIISTSIFSAVSAGLILGFVSLKRNYAATTDFAINHADQMRISDYLALDFRRTISVQAAVNDTTLYIPTYYDANNPPQPRDAVIDGKGQIFYGPAVAERTGPPLKKAITTAPLAGCVYSDYTAAGPATFTAIANGSLIIDGVTLAANETVFVTKQSSNAQNGLYTVTNPGSAGGAWTLTAHALKIRYYLAGDIIYRNEQGALNQPTALARDVQDFVFEPSDLGKVVKTSITFKPTFKAGGASEEIKRATAFHNTTLLRNNRGVY